MMTATRTKKPVDYARKIALELRGINKNYRHRATDPDSYDDLHECGRGKVHYVYHKDDQDGNEYVALRNHESDPERVLWSHCYGQTGDTGEGNHAEVLLLLRKFV